MTSVAGGMMCAVSQAEFSTVVKRLRLPSTLRVVIGVSGGPDSMALLQLANAYFQDVQGIIVDHGLRVESSDEARTVGRWLAEKGYQYRIMTIDWSSLKGCKSDDPEIPHNNVMDKARQARYELLLQACHDYKSQYLLTGHQLDDQAETVILRLMRASGVDGLKGIRPITIRQDLDPGIRLVRPMLSFAKSRIYATCRASGIPWVEDPTNNNIKYQRNSIRQGLQMLYNSSSVTSHDIADLAHTMAEVTARYETEVSDILSNQALVDTKLGILNISMEVLSNQTPPVMSRLLARIIQWASGRQHSPGLHCLHTLCKLLKNKGGSMRPVALAGCMAFSVNGQSEPRLGVCRQPPQHNSLNQLSNLMTLGQSLWWDGRYDVTLRQHKPTIDIHPPYLVRHLNKSDWPNIKLHVNRSIKSPTKGHYKALAQSDHLPDLCHHSLPVLTDMEGHILCVPHIGYINDQSPVCIQADFRPRHPLQNNF